MYSFKCLIAIFIINYSLALQAQDPNLEDLLSQYNGLPTTVKEITTRIQQDFTQSGQSLITDYLTSSPREEIQAFVKLIEKGDNSSAAQVLKILQENEGTYLKFLQELTLVIREKPIIYQRILKNLDRLSSEVSHTKLKIDLPVRCGTAFLVYVGMLDWSHSYASSFLNMDSKAVEKSFVGLSNMVRNGLLATTFGFCLNDFLVGSRTFKSYKTIINSEKKSRRIIQDLIYYAKDLKENSQIIKKVEATRRFSSATERYLSNILKNIEVDGAAESVPKESRLKFINYLRTRAWAWRSKYYNKKLQSKINDIAAKLSPKEIESLKKMLKTKESVALDFLNDDMARLYSVIVSDIGQDLKIYGKKNYYSHLAQSIEIEQDHLRQLIKSHRPNIFTRSCFTGMGLSTVLLGLHAAAGRKDNALDNGITRWIRNDYQDVQPILIPALISPCLFQLVFLPQMTAKQLTRKKSVYQSLDWPLIRQALRDSFNHHQKDSESKFYYYYELGDDLEDIFNKMDRASRVGDRFHFDYKLQNIPSLACLKNILQGLEIHAGVKKVIRSIASKEDLSCMKSVAKLVKNGPESLAEDAFKSNLHRDKFIEVIYKISEQNPNASADDIVSIIDSHRLQCK